MLISSNVVFTQNLYPVGDGDGRNKDIYFVLMDFTKNCSESGVVPAVQVALDMINNHSRYDLLDGGTLHYLLYESQVCRTVFFIMTTLMLWHNYNI